MTPRSTHTNDGLVLTGIDGSNPLGFLAALGMLRSLSFGWPDGKVRLAWHEVTGWRPLLYTLPSLSREALVGVLASWLAKMKDHPALTVDRDLKINPKRFREYAVQAAGTADMENRCWADFAAAFGCDATADNGVIQDTAFRTMSGAGHQHFLEFMCKLVAETTIEQLDCALFKPWKYDDPGPSMRWDPEDDRRYALRWQDPSGDKITTIRGANRLAIEALPLFPTAPANGSLLTTGFRGKGSRDTFLTWPIWTPPIDVDTVRSLLAHDELQQDQPRREVLAPMGVAEIYRSQRLTVGKYRNFAPAEPV